MGGIGGNYTSNPPRVERDRSTHLYKPLAYPLLIADDSEQPLGVTGRFPPCAGRSLRSLFFLW